jgi:peptide/nickel transport system substrate-binding protein
MRRILMAAVAAAGLAQAFPARADDLPVLRMALREDADQLDPTLGRSYVGRIVFAGLCDKLFDIDEKLNIIGQLAAGYEWANSTTLVIKLRPNVKFQDGTGMDAEAVKYSLERHLTMQGSSRRAELAGMDHVEVVDPLTVRVVLKTPNAPFLAQLTDRAGMIVSPTAAKAAGKDFGAHPVCAGPFKFTERVAQDRIVLDRFPDYWNASAIHFSRVVYQPIADSSVRLANLQAGAIDLSEQIVPSDVDAVKNNPKLKLVVSDGLGYQGIDFNIAHGPRANTPIGQDARVRKAFELSIDRDALVKVVYNGLYAPVAQPLPPGSPFYDPRVVPAARDVAAAKVLLAQAGVKLPVVVNLTINNNPDLRQLGEVIQAMAAESGFDVKLNATEFASGLDAADRGDFEAYQIGWSGRADPDGNLWNFTHTGGPLNYPAYSNKDVDSWLEQARATPDVAARRALYAKVIGQTSKDLPILYLFVPRNIVGMTSRLSGFVPVADGIIRLQNMTLSK